MPDLVEFAPHSRTGADLGPVPAFANQAMVRSGNVRCRFTYVNHPFPIAASALSAESDLWTGKSLVDWAFLPGSEVDQTEFMSSGPIYSIVIGLAEVKSLPNFVRWADAARRELSLILNFSPARSIATLNMIVATSAAGPATLASVVADIRSKVDLPIRDIARMCGVGRRQFYNLLAGASRTSGDELRIRTVHSYIDRLYSSLGNRSSRVRAVLLTPLAKFGNRTLFDSIVHWQPAEVEALFSNVVSLLTKPESELHRGPAVKLRLSDDQMLKAAAALKERRRRADVDSE